MTISYSVVARRNKHAVCSWHRTLEDAKRSMAVCKSLGLYQHVKIVKTQERK